MMVHMSSETPLSPTQTEEHSNATAYRRAADAFRAGDLATIESLVDPEVVWHVPGEHPWARDYRGREDVSHFLARLPAIGFWLREHDVFGDDVHVCALSEMGASRPGIEVSTRVVSIFQFRAGRQVERWLYPDDMAAWNAIFG
jgi:ketosteroid isomerase-like protein